MIETIPQFYEHMFLISKPMACKDKSYKYIWENAKFPLLYLLRVLKTWLWWLLHNMYFIAEYARRRRRRRQWQWSQGNMAAKHQMYGTCSLGLPCTYLILDIHAMLDWHLSIQGICWPVSRGHIAGLSWELILVTCFFEVDRWPSAGFSIGLCAPVGLNCLKQGQVIHNASPGLKVNWIIP